MTKTAFYDKHIAKGAKMVDFAGFDMPVQYAGIKQEHLGVREKVGLFDVSHMGEFILKGHGALELIQQLCSNDASKLTTGKVQYSCMPNDKGGIVDDLLVYCLGEEEYMLVVNASNIEKDWNWIQQHNVQNVEMKNISDKTSLLALQGPNAHLIAKELCNVDLENLKYYTFLRCTFAGVENVLVSATGYTGAGGYELYFDVANSLKIWDQLFSVGDKYGLIPAGLAARDTLRLEMGFCLYGNDINDTTSPIEAGLSWITKFNKTFTHSEILQAQKEKGVTKMLMGFEMVDKAIPRQNYLIKDTNNNAIGVVTSGTMSPSLSKGIGMGYVSSNNAKIGDEVLISIRDKNYKAVLVKLPFYKPN